MHNKIGNTIGILAGVVAGVMIVADQPMIAAIIVAGVGGLVGTIVRRGGKGKSTSNSTGIR